MGLGGVTVRLSGMGEAQTTTDDSGGYEFRGLRAGTYSVEISGFPTDEVSFSSTSGAATVGVGETKVVPFDGTYVRTAGIQGQVSVDGEGLGGVTVTLLGEGEDRTETTNAAGQYSFSMLKSGTYQVGITNPDPDDYEFETTSKTATIATGEVANVPFEGTLLRTAGIAGRVSVEGMGLDDVTVTLAGAEERTTTTSNGGQYSFAGLAAGTYVVSIANPDEVAYDFAEEDMTQNVTLADDQSAIVNFSGTHTRSASVTGLLYIDEAPQDKMYTANEPPLVNPDPMAPGMPLLLQGPGINDVTPGMAMADGTFAFEGLMAGSYRVLVNMTDEVAAGLATAGFEFVGDLTGAIVHVAAGMAAQVNFPFRITTQTITVGAVMGNAETVGDPVNGVMLSLYPTADDAEDGTNMLGEAMATAGEGPAAGMAKFDFPRAMDSSPGSDETDNLVFVKVDDPGSEDLVVTANGIIEIEYPGVARAHAAPAHVRLLNSAVNIQFWIKSDEDAKDGNKGLEGWAYEYCMPMADDPATMDVDEENTCMAADDGTPAVFTPVEDADGEAVLTDEEGKGSLSFTADAANLPAMVYIRAAMDQANKIDMGEKYEQTDALMHEHDGLILPANNDPAKNMELDKGPVHVSFTTQSLFIGAHRELDDRTGFTDNIGVGGGDKFPTGDAIGEVEVTLMKADSRGRLRAFEYDHDLDPETPDAEAVGTFGANGQIKFAHVPAEAEVTAVARAGSGMTIVPDDRDYKEIDAFASAGSAQQDEGVFVGGFGPGAGGGGARPDVWLCPMQRQDGTENCSTYAYKWEDGTISGSIGGLRPGDKDVVVTLTPVNTNPDYAADLEQDTEVAFGAADFMFDKVADGKYQIKLEGVAGKWSADSTTVTVVHDEVNSDGDGENAAVVKIADGTLSATSLRLAIQGVVANDRNDNGSLVSTESRSGVALKLFKASKLTSGKNKNRFVTSGTAIDETTTDSDGIYEFTGLEEGEDYIVEAVAVDGSYRALRNRGSKVAADGGDFDMVSQAYVAEAANYDDEFDGGTPPRWNHVTNKIENGGTANFALLWEDGTAVGTVSDPSVRKAHDGVTVELHRCLVDGDITGVDDNNDGDFEDAGDTAPRDDTDDNACHELGSLDPSRTTTANAKGEWEVTGLLEGMYEVSIVRPTRYNHSDGAGNTADNNGEAAGTSPTDTDPYWEYQLANLTGGRGDDADLETFYIARTGSGIGTTSGAPAVLVKDGTRTVAHEVATPGYVAYNTASVSLKLTAAAADPGATYGIAVPNSPNRKAFEDDEADTWPLKVGGGTDTLDVEVTSGHGYSKTTYSAATATSAPIAAIHRDRDNRLQAFAIDVGVNNDVARTRAQLEALGSFLDNEEQRSAELDPNHTTGGNTRVDLGTFTVATGTTTVTVQASAKAGSGVTVAFNDSDGTGNSNITAAGVMTISTTATTAIITITDDGRAGNTRQYVVAIKAAS